MNERIQFLKEYVAIFKTERYSYIVFCFLCLAVTFWFSGSVILSFTEKIATKEIGTDDMAKIIGVAASLLGSTGIVGVSLNRLFKFMERAENFANQKTTTNENDSN